MSGMDNLNFSRNEKEVKEKQSSNNEEEEIILDEIYNFEISDKVMYKNLFGIIIKQVSKDNFWVAFPEKESRLSSFPFEMDVCHSKDLTRLPDEIKN